MNIVRLQILLAATYENPLLRELTHGVITYASRHTTWQIVRHNNATTAELRTLRPAGILATTVDETEVHCWSQLTNTPLVVLFIHDEDPEASHVCADEQAIAEMAVEHFASLGLKHLAYFGDCDLPFVDWRLRAFAAAAAARGYGVVAQLIGTIYDPERRSEFETDLKVRLKSLPRPCGLLAANDDEGVILVQACRSVGLRVPEDIAILGVDNDHVVCELSEVPLSSIVQPMFSIGYEGARLLHEQIKSKVNRPTSLALPPLRVVARASTDLIAVEDEDVAAALRLIKDHFTEPISVAWVVEQIPVSRRSLYSRFLKTVGRTVLQQIRHVRFEKAKELLAESDLGLEIVAQRSGFANRTWLTRNFRRDLKTTPARFRRQSKVES